MLAFGIKRNKDPVTIEKKRAVYYDAIIGHNVKDNEWTAMKRDDFKKRSKKVQDENKKDTTYHF